MPIEITIRVKTFGRVSIVEKEGAFDMHFEPGVVELEQSTLRTPPDEPSQFCKKLPPEDYSLPELESEYAEEMFEVEESPYYPGHYRMPALKGLAFKLIARPSIQEGGEVNDGFLPSEKGGEWVENQDDNPFRVRWNSWRELHPEDNTSAVGDSKLEVKVAQHANKRRGGKRRGAGRPKGKGKK